MGRGFIRLSAAPQQADREPGLHPEYMHVGDCNVMQLGLPALTAAVPGAEVTTVIGLAKYLGTTRMQSRGRQPGTRPLLNVNL
jgi:hypothetical protein